MIGKILKVLRRDFIISARDSMLILISVMPILLAIAVRFFAPGLHDSAIKLAMLESDEPAHIEYMQDYARVELFPNIEELERRVLKRDDAAGMVPKGDGWEIVTQGNENAIIEDYSKMLNALYELGSTKDNTTARIASFGLSVPPVKTKLLNMLILIIIMMSGMSIAVNIVGEKTDNTISAMNVTPVSQTGIILGKSLLGGCIALVDIIAAILILGYWDINWVMIIIIGVSSMILSFVVGFLQGINSEDIMEAAGGVKMLMVPIAGSIAGYELIAENWQWTMYWSPFYWAYKTNNEILSRTADWSSVLLSFGIILAISVLIYVVSIPKIRRGLS